MSDAPRGYRSQLGRVRGLGSAKEGVHHWWISRVTSIALIPLGLWLAVSVIALAGSDHAAVTAWIAQPVTLGLLILTVLVTVEHSRLGVRVVLEDYISGKGVQLAAILANDFLHVALGLAALIALLTIAFGD